MNEISELEWQSQFRPPAAGSAAEVLARKLATPDLGEAAEVAAERAAADARAVQREQLLIANKVAGDPFGQVSRHEAMCAEIRGDLTDLEAQVEAKRKLLTRTAENLIHWRGEAEEVHRAVSLRSDTGDLLAPAKAVLAGHQAYVQASRAAIASAGTPRQARRPKGHGGYVSRSEPVTCPECLAIGATPEEAFAIHHPELLPPMEAMEEQAERGRDDYGRLISR